MNLRITKRSVLLAMLVFALIGFIDATYLTVDHYTRNPIECAIGNCSLVLTSSYSEIQGIPVSLIGAIYYLFMAGFINYTLRTEGDLRKYLLIFAGLAFLTSLYLVYLQLFVIRSICFYCMISAGTSTILLVLAYFLGKMKLLK